MGDSLTAGYGLAPDEGFVPRLQAWLDAEGVAAEVLNAGVSGDTTAGGLSRAEWTLTPEVDALIVELGGNDLLRGIEPATVRENLAGILDAAEAAEVAVLLVGLTAAPNYGADYKAEFDAIFPELAAEYGTLLYPDFFAALTAVPDRRTAMRDLMQPDAIHPSAAGVELVVEAIGPSVAALVEAARE